MDFSEVKEEIKQLVKVNQYVGTNKRIDCPESDCDGKGKKADCQLYEDSWYCFICKSRGDIISWVMLTQKCTFPMAVRTLANYAGISLEPHPERSSLLERFLQESVKYLTLNPSKSSYMVSNRGINLDILENHGIGYCDVEGLVLENTGLSTEQLLNLGLLYPSSEGGYRNHMGGRFLFPIRDIKGNLVNIKGRINPLECPDSDPKRKSMPLKADGPWGRHSHMDHLYLEELLSIYNEYVFICEGEPDTLTLRSWGINAVGMMTNTGIAKHAHKFKKFKRVYFVLDNDPNTQKHIVTELYNFQIKLPDTVIYNVTLPHFDEDKKVDVNDYKVKFGKSKQDFHKLCTGSPEAVEIILGDWSKHFKKDRHRSAKIYNLIRSLPSRRDRNIDILSALTGVDKSMLEFATDTSG